MTETPNPFTNGKLVATNYDQREYIKQDAKRGDPGYVMSRSDLMEFAKCPSRWRRGYRDAEEGTDATEWGSLIDCLLFDSNRFNDRFAVKPKTYENEKGEQKKWNGNATKCKEWLESISDKVPVSNEDHMEASFAINRLRDDELIWNAICDSDYQVYCTADYRDKETGIVVPVKVLSDIVPKRDGMVGEPDFVNSIIDFKTGKSANPLFWPREVNSRGYDMQAAMNLDVYNAATGEERFEFYHIIQESFSPYETSFPILSAEFVQMGRDKYLTALKRYALCLKTNHWGGYDESFPFDKWSGHPAIQPEAYMVRS